MRGNLSLEIPKEIIIEAMGNSFASVHVLNLDNDEYANDIIIYTFKGNGHVEPNMIFKVYETWGAMIPGGLNLTDDNGMFIYYNLTPTEYQIELIQRGVTANFTIPENYTTGPMDIALAPVFDIDFDDIKFCGDADLLDFLPEFKQVGAIVHVVDENGSRVEGAEIIVDGGYVDTTNSTGTFPVELQPGNHTIQAKKTGLYSNTVRVFIPERIKNEVEDKEENTPGFGINIVAISVLSIVVFLYQAKK